MRRSKYNAKPVTTNDGRFDSTGEWDRWRELLLLQRAGVISELRRQVPFILESRSGAKIGKLVMDFVYVEKGQKIASDFKGFTTDLARWKLNHFSADYPDYTLVICTAPSKRRAA